MQHNATTYTGSLTECGVQTNFSQHHNTSLPPNHFYYTTNSSSNATTPSHHNALKMNITAKYVIYASYGIIFFVGVLGNAMVIYVIGVKSKLSRSFDIRIMSLASADLLASIFPPLVAVHDIETDYSMWTLGGNFGCKVFVAIDHITVYVSAFTLVVISTERLRVISSVQAVRSSTCSANIINLTTWVMAVSAVVPLMYAQEVHCGMCWPWKWTHHVTFSYYAVQITLSCIIPMFLLVAIYTSAVLLLAKKEVPGVDQNLHKKRKKQFKKIMKMFGWIVILFFLLTMPHTVFNFVISYYGTFDIVTYLNHQEFLNSLHYVLYTICHFNCCVNPFVYANMHRNMRRTLKRTIISVWRTYRTARRERSARHATLTSQVSMMSMSMAETP